MTDMKQLYQEMILDHNKNPRNFKELEHPTHKSEGYNPLCGDHYTLYLKVEDGKIVDVGFDGAGCAISKSSASIMTTCLKGSTVEEAEQLFENFHRMLTEETKPEDLPGKLCKITARSESLPDPNQVCNVSLAHLKVRVRRQRGSFHRIGFFYLFLGIIKQWVLW